MSKELWKVVKGYPDYEISSEGRVKSYKQKTPRIMKPKRFGKGYLGVVLCGDSRSHRYIHHMVLEAFVGRRPDGADACHNDGNKENNRLENLRWDTRSGNFGDKVQHGTMMIGVSHVNSKLSEADVLAIRSNPGNKTQKVLADEFGVSQGTVFDILSRRTWKHLHEERK